MRRNCTALVAVLMIVGLPWSLAEEPTTGEGFVRLDNGKDLTGWYGATASGKPTGNTIGWTVVNGAIHLDSSVARSCLFSERKHSRNVIIRLQFRASEGADSGIFIHGKQFQIRDYPNAGPKKYAQAAKPAGEWNDLEFDFTDGVAVVKLNGQVVEKAWKIGENPDVGIGLQREKGEFDFRHILLKEKK